MVNSNELLFEASSIKSSESVSRHCDQRGNEIRMRYLGRYRTQTN